MVTRKRARAPPKRRTPARTKRRTPARRNTTKKYMIIVETTTEKRGLTWDQAQRVKTNLNRKIGKRKGTKIKVVPY